MDAQLKKGLLEVCVLSVLRGGESYGYKIISDVAPYIEISESTLYPILKRLEAAGAVTTQSRGLPLPMRRFWMTRSSLTASGTRTTSCIIYGCTPFRAAPWQDKAANRCKAAMGRFASVLRCFCSSCGTLSSDGACALFLYYC